MKTFLSWLRSIFGHHAQPTSKAPSPVPVTHPAPEPVPVTPAPVPAPIAPAPPVVIPNPAPVVVTPAPTPVPNPEPLPAVPVVPAPAPVPVPVVVPVLVSPAPAPSAPDLLPTFIDTFAEGKLDTSKWIPSTWSAPGSIPGKNNPFFTLRQLDFSHGCLRIRVSQVQNLDGSVTSEGGELQSRQRFGFGTYEWILRASSTSETPQGSGRPVSGQISSGFLFQQDSGYTEIDSPEIEGDKPLQFSWTSWTDAHTKEYTATDVKEGDFYPDAAFRSYKAVWSADGIDFYVDGVFQIRHKHIVPHVPAYAMINHWGTNSQGWGGLATPGTDRYMFVKRFSFTPA